MKRAQFNFVWLFAILAGAVILFLAIYGAVRSADTGQQLIDTTTAASLSILTDPLESGFADSSFGVITFTDETRVDAQCLEGGLGSMRISVASRSSPTTAWSTTGLDVSVPNKYIFVREGAAAYEFTVFSKPFAFPYEVADLLFLIPEDYCFVGAPKAVQDEVLQLGLPRVEFDSCNATEPIRVCFGGSGDCDMRVTCGDADCSKGSVEKQAATLSFVGSLLYGAIFADADLYTCNAKRLTNRAAKIAQGLMEKADLMNARDCSSNLKPALFVWSSRLQNATVKDLSGLDSLSQDLDRKNKVSRCKAW